MRRTLFVVFVLVAMTLAVYWRVSHHEFINYDDPDYVTENALVQSGFTWEGLVWAFGNIHGERTYWHPLTWLSHMLDCQLFGLNAGAHHLGNVLFHVINAILVFLLLKKMTGSLWPSAAVAGLFALHPLQVDTVAWVTERKNVLSTLFWLLTLLAYVRYAERPALKRYALVLLSLIFGLMAKPILVTLPCVMLLLDFWPLRRWRPAWSAAGARKLSDGTEVLRYSRSSLTRLVVEKLPFFCLALVSSLVTVLAHEGLRMGYAVHRLPWWARLENALVSYVRYLGKTLWPENLCILYPHPGVWQSWQVYGSAAVLLTVTLLAIRAAGRHPAIVVGWFWFLGTLVPTIGLVQVGIQAMADRFAYVPLIGLFLMIVWGMTDIAAGWKRRKLILGSLSAAALVSCMVMTSLQLRYWQNSITLFEHTAQITTNNFVAHNNLAFALAKAGKFEEAKPHVSEALRIKPDAPEARFQMGLIFDAQDKLSEAVTNYEQAIRLRPGWPTPIRLQASALARLGQSNEAIAKYESLLQIDPNDDEGHSQLALLLSSQQKTAAAIAHYRAALRLKPNMPEALNNLAWILATHPAQQFRNGAEAVRLAERACALTQRQKVLFVGTLAAAYAENGRFAEAIQTAREACELAQSQGQSELAATNRKLLNLYRTAKPYREGLNLD